MDQSIAHLRDIMDERDLRYQQRFEGQERALHEAKEETNARLGILNELRGDVATKTEMEALEKIVQELRGQIADLRERLSTRDGRGAGMTAGWAILVGAAMLALAAFAAFR